MKKIVSSLFAILVSFACFAQQKTEMADTMRSNGRIYVVVAVLTVILIGLILYLVRIDRKISRLERGS
jgi:hypothetical protein